MKRCPQCGYKEPKPVSHWRKKLGTALKVKVWRKDRDLEAMKRLKDPRSYIRLDGSEVLYGEDWTARKDELQARSKGTCEQVCPGGRCLADAHDPHHVKKRWPHRDDRLSNLLHVCRTHHEALDPRKIRSGKVGA